jgi:pimeloyl-ACP methyl ester carboxylesterase
MVVATDERRKKAEMATSTINGVELYYEITGTGDFLVLTHGSWTDGTSWGPAVNALAERYRVVVWDRRGHSRSQAGDGPGSRAGDAADLAGLIEQVSGEPVHIAGNSYGANVTLTLLTERPELVATAAVHEPPLFGLLEGTRDQALADELSVLDADLAVVSNLISLGNHRDAAEYFIEHVALGPGTWDGLAEAFREVLEVNAPTYLDELADETALLIDAAALATTRVPLLLTYGTESPELFPAVITELAQLVPAARVEVLEGAGHIPHATHPENWVARLVAFHDHHLRSQLQWR